MPVANSLQVLEERGGQFQTGRPGLTVEEFDLRAAPARFHQGVDRNKRLPTVCPRKAGCPWKSRRAPSARTTPAC